MCGSSIPSPSRQGHLRGVHTMVGPGLIISKLAAPPAAVGATMGPAGASWGQGHKATPSSSLLFSQGPPTKVEKPSALLLGFSKMDLSFQLSVNLENNFYDISVFV